MSAKSKLKKSRDKWKGIAVSRSNRDRYRRKELQRIKKDRDLYKKNSHSNGFCGDVTI